MRTSRLVALMLLAACGKIVREEDDAPIACAVDGATMFTNDCRALAIGRGDGWVVTVRHPTGGFRRFAIDASGGVSAADGAAAVTGRTLADGQLEVEIDGDRYRLPAKR